MANQEVATSRGRAMAGLASREQIAANLSRASQEIPRTGTDGREYLKMFKDGTWVYGQDAVEVAEDSLWAVHPGEISHGWICWDQDDTSNGPKGEVMVPLTRAKPSIESLPAMPADLEWSEQYSILLVCVAGEDEGAFVEYKNNSVGSMKFFGTFIDAVLDQIASGASEIVPIISLGAKSYPHKKYGKVYNPVFEIKEWRDLDDDSPVAQADDADTSDDDSRDADEELEKSYQREAAKSDNSGSTTRRRRRS